MQIYFQNLTLLFLIFLGVSVAACQSTATPETENYPSAATTATSRSQTTAFVDNETNETFDNSEKAQPTANPKRPGNICDQSQTIVYENLSAYVGDYWNHRTGECFVVENVPLFSKIKNAENEFGNRKGLFYLETESQTDVGDTFISSLSMSHQLGTFLTTPQAKSLRVTAVLVEFRGEFEVFRSPYAIRIEGLDENKQVVWAASGTNPPKHKLPV